MIGKPIGKLSKGFRQRVGMAQVLLHEPEVLILDEPTAGLEPNQIREVRNVRRLGQSKTILLSTHILQEVTAISDRVLFIHEGRLAFDGPPSSCQGRARRSTISSSDCLRQFPVTHRDWFVFARPEPFRARVNDF